TNAQREQRGADPLGAVHDEGFLLARESRRCSASFQPRAPSSSRNPSESGRAIDQVGVSSPPNWLLNRVTGFSDASVRSFAMKPSRASAPNACHRRNALAPIRKYVSSAPAQTVW